MLIQKKNSVLDNEEPDVKKTTALTTVITSLRKFTNYSIQILAYTRMGDGVLSSPKYCHTEEDGKDETVLLLFSAEHKKKFLLSTKKIQSLKRRATSRSS